VLREVEVSRLAVGMYVAELDRPWLETPFPLQGFYVRSEADVGRVAEYCHTVFVDPRRFDARLIGSVRAPPESVLGRAAGQPAPSARLPLAEGVEPVHYEDEGTVEDELPAARQALEAGGDAFESFWQQLTVSRRVPIAKLRTAVDPLVESILRNKDALVTLMRVRHLDRHTHEHCMALAVWGSLLGRQLGLPPAEIRQLALGCSLVDIGKIRLPRQLLRKPAPLTPAEYAIVQAHVDYSLQMLHRVSESDRTVVETVRWHHERMDGSGYPDGLAGGAIPMAARIAGIVDSYDAMISPRSYAPTCSSYQALVELQDQCPTKFQTELVDQFAQAVGLFPNGALVELSTGEVGVVCGQNPGRRLRPKVMLILDGDKRQREDLRVVDLRQNDEHELRIARELARGEYGIDAREYFL
jgi:HD-GYP domain-containing protein (c-di-GMP phosphodiesterase class II)